MKKLLFILFVSIALNAHAQKSEWLFGLGTKDSCRIFADSVIKNFKAKYKYSLDKEISSAGAKYYAIYYTSDSLKKVNKGFDFEYAVIFQRFDEGENKALEIQGKPRYYIKELKGDFLELLPVWLKYIDGNADKLKLANSGFTKKIIVNPANSNRYTECIFRENAGYDIPWELRFINQ
jgi:hypothetical protein